MKIKTKTLKFHGVEVTFAQHAGYGWIIPAKLLGLVLGYKRDGQDLADTITEKWKKDWAESDYRIFSGDELKALKEETPQYGVSSSSNSSLFLTIPGVIKCLIRSNAKLAKEFREFLAKNGGEVLEGYKIPAPRIIKNSTSKKLAKAEVQSLPGNLSAQFAVLAEMKKYGMGQEFIQPLLMEIWDGLKVKEKAIAPHTTKKDATQLVPVSNIQASSLTPNFDTIQSFFLTGHQKHPKYKNWLTAEEIGTIVGKSADAVKTHSSRYASDRGFELPNNELMQRVIDFGGYFRGVSSVVDENNLPCLINLTLGAMAVWYLTEDGKMLWRNYWSPEASLEILKRCGMPEVDARAALGMSGNGYPQIPPSGNQPKLDK